MEGKNPVELPQSYMRFEIPVMERQIPTPRKSNGGSIFAASSQCCGEDTRVLALISSAYRSTSHHPFHAHNRVRITIDSGATRNMICHNVVQPLGCRMTPSSQSVHQADGSSPLHAHPSPIFIMLFLIFHMELFSSKYFYIIVFA